MQVTNTSLDTVVVGTSKVESFKLAQTREFFEILTKNLYKNPLKAVVRETMCNAWDAHIQAKTKKPIQVDIEGNCLVVRDWGNGIPHEKMKEIYAIFGSSTKVYESNQTGGFGLGCKAPFAITDTFTVTNVCQGKKVIYTCIKNDPGNEGLPSIRTIASFFTAQPNGLTVQIPLGSKEHGEIREYIKEVSFLGGIPVQGMSFDKEAIIKCEGFFLARIDGPGSVYENSRVLCRYGNVVYPIDTDYFPNTLNKRGCYPSKYIMVLEIPPDTLTIAPSRESLVYDDRTIETINKTYKRSLNYINSVWKECAWSCISDSKCDLPTRVNYVTFAQHWNTYDIANNAKNVTPWEREIFKLGALYCNRKLPKRVLGKLIPSSLYPIYKCVIREEAAGKQEYLIKRLFKEDYKNIYLVENYASNKVAFRITYDFTRLITDILIFTNNIGKATSEYKKAGAKCYILSSRGLKPEQLQNKMDYYTKLGFKTSFKKYETVKSDKPRTSNRYAERPFYEKGYLRLGPKDITCWSNYHSYEQAIRNLFPLLSAIPISTMSNCAFAEMFKDINCLEVGYGNGEVSYVERYQIPRFSDYLRTTWFNTHATEELQNKFMRLYCKLFPVSDLSTAVFHRKGSHLFESFVMHHCGTTTENDPLIKQFKTEVTALPEQERLLFLIWFENKSKEALLNEFPKYKEQLIKKFYTEDHAETYLYRLFSCGLDKTLVKKILTTIIEG